MLIDPSWLNTLLITNRLSTGVVRACTPPLSWGQTRFSWSHWPPRRQHDLIGRHLAVIGDEEEVAVLLTEPHAAILSGQSLAEQAWDGSTVRFRSTKSLSGPACRDEPRFYQNRCDRWSAGQRLVTRSDDILPAAE